MPFEIQMPHVGESVTEAVIGKWLKSPGERIEKYEPIVEVVTDKVAMEVPAPATGELTRIVVEEGETVSMGAVIAEMEAEEGTVSAEAPYVSRETAPETPAEPSQAPTTAPQQPAKAHKPSSTPLRLRRARADSVGSMVTGSNVGPTGGAFSDTSLSARLPASPSPTTDQSQGSGTEFARLSPAVRRLIDSHGLDVAAITGTGVGGRITRADVLRTAEEQNGPASGEVAVSGQLQKPSPVRRMIAEHMAKSFREIPHAWSAVEVDVSGIAACRSGRRDVVREQHGINLTYLPFTLAVAAAALRNNPLLNASWQQEGILMHDEVSVGIAAAGKDGLVVPVVRNADQKGILTLATELSGLVERAREGKLSLEDVSGGTFTLNNTGALGSVWGGAIINHPQAAILTTEAIVKRPVAVSDESGDDVQVRPMMNICLSFDHRVIDGAEASAFLQDVKQGLEAITADTALE